MPVTRQSSLFMFLLRFLFAAHRTRSKRVIKTSNNLSLVVTFKYNKLRKFISKNDISSFVKRKMRILFLMKCQRANSFSLKHDLNPPHLLPCDKCVWANGKYGCIVSPVLNLHTAPKLRPIFSAHISKTHA